MINRDYKLFAPGSIHHVFNRGNNKMEVFRSKEDFEAFILRLKVLLGMGPDPSPFPTLIPFPRESFSIIAYCLMPNHFHFTIEQLGSIPTSKLIAKLCTSFSFRHNRVYDHIGHVFQRPFKAVSVDTNEQLLHLTSYIHNNPKTAGLIDRAEDWPYSSYQGYLGIRRDPLCNPRIVSDQFENTDRYREFCEKSFEITKARKAYEYLFIER